MWRTIAFFLDHVGWPKFLALRKARASCSWSNELKNYGPESSGCLCGVYVPSCGASWGPGHMLLVQWVLRPCTQPSGIALALLNEMQLATESYPGLVPTPVGFWPSSPTLWISVLSVPLSACFFSLLILYWKKVTVLWWKHDLRRKPQCSLSYDFFNICCKICLWRQGTEMEHT